MAEDLAYLVYRVALGDQHAFEALYRHTSPRLYGLAVSILRRRELAEDVLQEVFVSAWHSAASYSADKGSVQTWLNIIVRNRCIDRLRKEPQRSITLEDEDWERIEHDGITPLQELESDAEAEVLARCLEGLDSKQRQSLTLAYFNGMTHVELADYLKAPLGTVKAWVRRGLERLRGCLIHEI
ncbi:MAG TPA: sigma-70 family RNA polymerase sigma factor [Pseudomonadales bacterium]|nr:sigma-70 family RNA polymerase sigma factor [Pseudomonadales bacterium]